MKWQPRVFRKKDAETKGPIERVESVIRKKEKSTDGKGLKSKRPLAFLTLPTMGTSSASASSRDASDDKVMPRIGIHLSVAELREEGKARGIESCYLPNNKIGLLEFLVDGSIHLRATEAWKDIESLRNKMEEDCRKIEEEKEVHFANETVNIFEQNEQSEYQRLECEQSTYRDQENSDLEESMQLTRPSKYYGKKASYLTDDNSTCIVTVLEENLIERTVLNLLEGQFNLANLSCGGGSGDGGGSNTAAPCSAPVPPHALLSQTLWGDGLSQINSDCDDDSDSDSDSDNGGDNESDSDDCSDNGCDSNRFDDHSYILKDIANIESAMKRKKESCVKWDASLQFEQWIINPPVKNKTPQGNIGQGFTVWCSFLSPPMASGKIQDPLTKYFDSHYKTLDDANDRARYLFYWQNPWCHPEDLRDFVKVKSKHETQKESATSYHGVNPDGEEWKVNVVPDSVFKYLDHATQERHSFDNKGDF